MLSSALQILAFALALLGMLGATVATVLPNWKVSADVGANVMTAVSQMQGLWADCAWYSTGVISCSLKPSVLSLPAHLQAARATMVLACMVASLGLCLAALGLKCTRWGGSHRAKGHTAVAAGGCFVLAGVLCLVPASWFTRVVITAFLDASVPASGKYEPGGAVYVTFVSAGFLLAAGVLFCLSCPGRRPSGQPDGASPSDPGELRRREELRQERLRREARERMEKEAAAAKREAQKEEKKTAEGTGTQRGSPSRLPAPPTANAKARYSLQDYV